jgi:hypothetical protein
MLYYSQRASWRTFGSVNDLAETVSEIDQRDIVASLNGDGEAYAQLVQHYIYSIHPGFSRFE